MVMKRVVMARRPNRIISSAAYCSHAAAGVRSNGRCEAVGVGSDGFGVPYSLGISRRVSREIGESRVLVGQRFVAVGL